MITRFGKYALKGGEHLNGFLDFHFTEYLTNVKLQEDTIFHFLAKLASKFNMNVEEYCEKLLYDLFMQTYSPCLSYFLSSYFTWKWERTNEEKRKEFLNKLRKELENKIRSYGLKNQ